MHSFIHYFIHWFSWTPQYLFFRLCEGLAIPCHGKPPHSEFTSLPTSTGVVQVKKHEDVVTAALDSWPLSPVSFLLFDWYWELYSLIYYVFVMKSDGILVVNSDNGVNSLYCCMYCVEVNFAARSEYYATVSTIPNLPWNLRVFCTSPLALI